jgi:shikimate kinase/3-dehydroquinate dehydratase
VTLFSLLDPLLQDAERSAYRRFKESALDGLPRALTVVLVGHRAAGKSTLLPHLAALLRRQGFDLDDELERVHRRPIKNWVTEDVESFRQHERQHFLSMPRGAVVAVGGGFLSHNPALMRDCLPVLVPISFETYVERLEHDKKRPRLRPDLTIREELQAIYDERAAVHRQVKTMSVAELVARSERPSRALRVVTAPSGDNVTEVARQAAALGADILEVRTDLVDVATDLNGAQKLIRILVSERGTPLPEAWLQAASFVDRERPNPSIESWHVSEARPLQEVVSHFAIVPSPRLVKYVEPLRVPQHFGALLAVQKTLGEIHGPDNVTVLATGESALPFRAKLAELNAFDYLALDNVYSAAAGQRLLSDAVREARFARQPVRRGILGSNLKHSRSPRIHRQPFDRIDLPARLELGPLLAALHPHYQGFAVTAPFKQEAAKWCETSFDAVNTLVRTSHGWAGYNTDVDGARDVLERLGAPAVTVLGDGGATVALRLAAEHLGIRLTVYRAAEIFAPLEQPCVYTWPSTVKVPASLRFNGVPVAVIAYGVPARTIARLIVERGGIPKKLGPHWFVAQARRQLQLWESERQE